MSTTFPFFNEPSDGTNVKKPFGIKLLSTLKGKKTKTLVIRVPNEHARVPIDMRMFCMVNSTLGMLRAMKREFLTSWP